MYHISGKKQIKSNLKFSSTDYEVTTTTQLKTIYLYFSQSYYKMALNSWSVFS